MATREAYTIVSSGTLRKEDLIPAFIAALDKRKEEIADDSTKGELERAKIVANIDTVLGCIEQQRMTMSDGVYYDACEEESEFDLEILQDLLCEVAPDGFLFGANEGDGACFGFWPVEDDDE